MLVDHVCDLSSSEALISMLSILLFYVDFLFEVWVAGKLVLMILASNISKSGQVFPVMD